MSLSFRPISPADLPTYLGWINQPAIWELDNPEPYMPVSEQQIQPRFNDFVRKKLTYIIVLQSRDIGYLGFKGIRGREAEFFIIIGDLTAQGKGYGRAAMHWLLNYGFTDLHLTCIHARVLGNNSRAAQFYRTLGFVYQGTSGPTFARKGSRYGILEYSLSKEQWLEQARDSCADE